MARRPKALAEVLTGPIATTLSGRDITRPWVAQLEQPRDPRLLQSVDWGVYDRILLDDQVKSCLQQRILAVVARPWDVLPGDDSPAAQEAAEALKAQLWALGWDRVTAKMLMATFYGWQVAELMWEARGSAIALADIRVRHGRRFRVTPEGELRLLTRANMATGEPLPQRKFWTAATGASDDDEPYGRGLAEWLYWPTYFKRVDVQGWMTFLDKVGVPTVVGTYLPGTPEADVRRLLDALRALSTDSAIALPQGMAATLLEAARSASGDFSVLYGRMDAAIAKIILSQTMTTDDGSSLAQGRVHADVKLEVVKADADLLSDSFNAGPARWWSEWNYGPAVAHPRVVRIVEEEADLAAQAATDEALARLGWERSDESFADTYGDGYRRKAVPALPAMPAPAPGDDAGNGGEGADDADEDGEDEDDGGAASFAEAPGADAIEAVAQALADEGWEAVMAPLAQPLLDAALAADSFEAAAAALAPALSGAQSGPLEEALRRAAFVARAITQGDPDEAGGA